MPVDWVEWLQSDAFARAVRLTVSAGLIFIAAGMWLTVRFDRRRIRNGCVIVLALLTLASGAAFVRFGKHPWIGGINSHEVFHYYLGPKYQAELGYSHLYPCAVVADREGEQLFRRVPKVRDVDTQRQFPREQVIDEAQECIERFSPQRWQEFKSDVEAIVSTNRSRERLVTDLGYVASPFWTSWASPVMQWVDPPPSVGMVVLCSLDYLLLAVALGVTCRTYGWMAGMVTASFVFTSFAIDSWTIRGSILRFDWLVALVTSVCCLRVGRYRTAGALAAFSILVRGFPLIFFLGLGVQALAGWVRRRSLPREHLAFFASLGLTAVILATPSLLQPGGVDRWKEFVARMSHHSELVRVKRVGFTAAVTYGGETSNDDFVTSHDQQGREAWSAEKQEKLAAVKPGLRLATVLVLGALTLAWVRLTPEATAALGVTALYFTVDVSWYYYIVLWVPCLVFSGRMGQWPGAMAIMVLGSANFLSLWIEHTVKFELRRYFLISWVVLVSLALVSSLLVFLREHRTTEGDLAGSN